MIARAIEKLRSHVNRALLVGADLNGRVPAKAQLLLAISRVRRDGTRLVGITVYAANRSALRFSVDVG